MPLKSRTDNHFDCAPVQRESDLPKDDSIIAGDRCFVLETGQYFVAKFVNKNAEGQRVIEWEAQLGGEQADRSVCAPSYVIGNKDMGHAEGDGVHLLDEIGLRQALEVLDRGGWIHVKAGRYVLTDKLILPENVRITGDGYGTVFVVPDDKAGVFISNRTSAESFVVTTSAKRTSNAPVISIGGKENTLEKLAIMVDANVQPQINGGVIDVQGERNEINRCRIDVPRGKARYGIHMRGRRCRVECSDVMMNDAVAVQIEGVGNKVCDNILQSWGHPGVRCAASARDNAIYSNEVYGVKTVLDDSGTANDVRHNQLVNQESATQSVTNPGQ